MPVTMSGWSAGDNKVTIARAISSTTQRCERQCVRRVVREIESAGVGKVGAARIVQPILGGLQQTYDLFV